MDTFYNILLEDYCSSHILVPGELFTSCGIPEANTGSGDSKVQVFNDARPPQKIELGLSLREATKLANIIADFYSKILYTSPDHIVYHVHDIPATCDDNSLLLGIFNSASTYIVNMIHKHGIDYINKRVRMVTLYVANGDMPEQQEIITFTDDMFIENLLKATPLSPYEAYKSINMLKDMIKYIRTGES